jgi:hypothetical protein
MDTSQDLEAPLPIISFVLNPHHVRLPMADYLALSLVPQFEVFIVLVWVCHNNDTGQPLTSSKALNSSSIFVIVYCAVTELFIIWCIDGGGVGVCDGLHAIAAITSQLHTRITVVAFRMRWQPLASLNG